MAVQNGAILFLLRYLQDVTDVEHPVSSSQLGEVLREHGFPCDHRTIATHIRTLNQHGFKVEKVLSSGIATLYYWADTVWDENELRILIDAVSSAQFISPRRSRAIIRKLSSLAGHQHERDLTPPVYVSENLKAENDQLISILNRVSEAIRQKKQISFRYYDYNAQKKRVARHDGEIYILSPYNTVWQDDRYYLVGWSEKHGEVVSFRVDRMELPRMLKTKAHPRPKTYRVQDYADRITRMYTGRTEEIELFCHENMVNAVIDKFGKSAEITPVEGGIRVRVRAAVTGTLMGWLFQFAGEIVLTGPEEVCDFYRDMLRQARADLRKGADAPVQEKVWKL